MRERPDENVAGLTDEELMKRLGGTPAEKDSAFRALWDRHQERAATVVRGVLREAGFRHLDVQDFVQQAFIRLYRKHGLYKRDRPFLPWFNAVVRNSVQGELRHERKRRSQESLPDTLPARGSSPPEHAELRDALAKLTAQDREDFLAVYQQGEKPAQVAHRTDRTTSQVYQALHRIRRELRTLLFIPPPREKKKSPPDAREGDFP